MLEFCVSFVPEEYADRYGQAQHDAEGVAARVVYICGEGPRGPVAWE